jgi:hydroxymethylpyrimidine pyrophosphatase-like HAD family hydrolase
MKRNNPKIVGVDFDGTLAITRGTYPRIQGPIQEIIDYVKSEQEAGAYLILITMREYDELRQAVEWCKEQGLRFDAVNDNLPQMKEFFGNNPRKIFCNEYLDDTNIGGIEGVLEQIRRKKKDDNN